jgi:hypothetical protein
MSQAPRGYLASAGQQAATYQARLRDQALLTRLRQPILS